jgi:hypothetical protein
MDGVNAHGNSKKQLGGVGCVEMRLVVSSLR